MKDRTINILIIEDSEEDEILVKRFAGKDNHISLWKCARTEEEMREALQSSSWDLVISDYRLPKFSGPLAIHTLKEMGLDIPLIIVSGTIGEDTAVEMLKSGATDYVLKSNLGRLPSAIERALREHQHIKEKQKAEIGLFREHQYLSVLMRSLPVVFYTCSTDTLHFNYISEQVREITGFSADAFQQRTSFWTEKIHPEDATRVMEQFKNIVEGRKSTLNFRFRIANGSYRSFMNSIQLCRFPGDSADSIVGAWMDVQEQSELEDEHRKIERQLIEVQKIETVGRLAGGVAHDINNVLAAITLFSELGEKQVTKGDLEGARKSFKDIFKAQESAASIVRQLLMFGRRRIGPPQIVDLKAVITGVQPLLQRLVGENFQIEYADHSPGPLQVKADKVQLEQIIMNLIVNARDAMPAGGKLLVKLGKSLVREEPAGAIIPLQAGDHALLSVQDSGHGMPPEVIKRLFEPFFTTKEPGKGTGLGLSVIFRILKQANGSVVVDSHPGRGTSFHIYLPLLPEESSPAPELAMGPAATASISDAKTLLLVEDEEPLREIITTTLENEGHTVLKSANGVEALKILKERKEGIDLIISDVMMPEMNGPQLAAQVKDLRPGLPLLFLSGYADNILKKNEFDTLSIGFLEKPFTSKSLVEKVHDIIHSLPRKGHHG